MANINKYFFQYVKPSILNSPTLKNNNNAKALAGYLYYLEENRQTRDDWNLDYVFASYRDITENTHITNKKTIHQTINLLQSLGIIEKYIVGERGKLRSQFYMNKEYLEKPTLEIIEENQETYQPIPNASIQDCNHKNVHSILQDLLESNKQLFDLNKGLLREINQIKQEFIELKKSMNPSPSMFHDIKPKQLSFDEINAQVSEYHSEKENDKIDYGKSFVYDGLPVMDLPICKLEKEIEFREENHIDARGPKEWLYYKQNKSA